MATNIRVLVGTRKAAFIYTSDEKREAWHISEPILPGWTVNHMAADLRDGTPRFYAAANHAVWGPSVAKSVDGGKTWDNRSEGLGFPPDVNAKVHSVWQVRPGHESQPGVVFAGADPAGLFRSEDWGASWSPVESIMRHEHRPFWQPIAGTIPPGAPTAIAGGPPVQSIEIDPRDASHMYIAISGGYVTLDGCKSWRFFSHRVLATNPGAEIFISQNQGGERRFDIDPAAALDLHKLVIDPKRPDRLWTQAHTGVFRSDDGGRAWEDVTPELASFHGFPIAVTKREPDAAYIVPLEVGTDNFRTCPGQLAVYRTRDAGATWDRLTDGLPGPHDYQSVYREGMDTDGLDAEGVYVGTSNGQVYASTDGGESWRRLPGTLPPVLSVTCAAL